jgi:hypothetical protein
MKITFDHRSVFPVPAVLGSALEKIQLALVDIEGLDIVPIKSIEKDVANRPAYVSIEVAHHDICSALDQLATLSRCGYSKFLFFNQGMRSHVRAPIRPVSEGRYAKFSPDQFTTGLFGEELDGRWLDIYGAAERLAEICRLHALFRAMIRATEEEVGLGERFGVSYTTVCGATC